GPGRVSVRLDAGPLYVACGVGGDGPICQTMRHQRAQGAEEIPGRSRRRSLGCEHLLDMMGPELGNALVAMLAPEALEKIPARLAGIRRAELECGAVDVGDDRGIDGAGQGAPGGLRVRDAAGESRFIRIHEFLGAGCTVEWDAPAAAGQPDITPDLAMPVTE